MKRTKECCTVCDYDENTKILHGHHIVPRYANGADTPNNIVILCPTCHALVHAGEIISEGWFQTTNGNTFFWHRRGEPHIIRPGVIFEADGKVKIINE